MYPSSHSVITILLIVCVIAALASLPRWPYSSGWGYYPSGAAGLIVVVLVVLLLFRLI